MLTVSDIVALAKSGFTAEQISKLAAHESRHENAPSQEKEKEPAPAPAPVPTPAPTPAPVPAPAQMDATAQKLDSILALMQAQNLMNAQMPKQETAEDIIANIINPNVNGGK